MKSLIRHMVFVLSAVFVLMLCVNVPSTEEIQHSSSVKIPNPSESVVRQSFIESATIPLPSQGYELVRLTSSFGQVALRNFNGSNFFRILRYSIIEQQKLQNYRFFYLHKYALVKSQGYYIFHLRKLLI